MQVPVTLHPLQMLLCQVVSQHARISIFLITKDINQVFVCILASRISSFCEFV